MTKLSYYGARPAPAAGRSRPEGSTAPRGRRIIGGRETERRTRAGPLLRTARRPEGRRREEDLRPAARPRGDRRPRRGRGPEPGRLEDRRGEVSLPRLPEAALRPG